MTPITTKMPPGGGMASVFDHVEFTKMNIAWFLAMDHFLVRTSRTHPGAVDTW